MSDQKRKWVILELSHQGEKKTPPELQSLLQPEIGEGVEIFVPSITFSRRESNVTICLMEGYFFVEAVIPPSTFFTLEELPYVRRVLTHDEPNGRFICYVEQDTVDELKEKLHRQAARDICVGDYVRVCEGAYSSLRGKILNVFADKERASVHIVDLKSMEVIVELPFQFFERIPANSDEDYEL